MHVRMGILTARENKTTLSPRHAPQSSFSRRAEPGRAQTNFGIARAAAARNQNYFLIIQRVNSRVIIAATNF
jgi:hypothetical protein